MKWLLSKEGRALLEQVSHAKLLVALDFDGTLSPIVKDRNAAGMRASTRRLLSQVADRYPTAVISGRALADVTSRLAPLAIDYVVGNHGLETENGGAKERKARNVVRKIETRLRHALADLSGVDLEGKGQSLAVHYRRARRRSEAKLRIVAEIAALGIPLRVMHGKAVVNVLPEGASHKGTALIDLRRISGCDTALFVGDDVTDEDVFSLDQPGRLLGVRIGASRSSRADWFLRRQDEIDALLTRLVSLRKKAAGQ